MKEMGFFNPVYIIRHSFIIFSLHFVTQNIVLFAKEVPLFSQGRPVSNYSEAIYSIEAGDTVKFSNHSFEVKSVLNKGGSEFIFDIGANKALRVYLRDQRATNKDYFWDAMEQFGGLNLPIPKFYDSESEYGEFRVVERVDVLFTLAELLSPDLVRFRYSNNGVEAINLVRNFDKEIAFEALVEFAKKFSEYNAISDFKPANIAFDGRDWWLLDCDPGVRKFFGRDFSTLFDKFTSLPKSVLSKIQKTTFEIRNLRPGVCERLIHFVSGFFK